MIITQVASFIPTSSTYFHLDCLPVFHSVREERKCHLSRWSVVARHNYNSTTLSNNRTYYWHINQSDNEPSHLRANHFQFQTVSAPVTAIHRRYSSTLLTSHARSASTTRWRFPDRFCTSQATSKQQRGHPYICTLWVKGHITVWTLQYSILVVVTHCYRWTKRNEEFQQQRPLMMDHVLEGFNPRGHIEPRETFAHVETGCTNHEE